MNWVLAIYILIFFILLLYFSLQPLIEIYKKYSANKSDELFSVLWQAFWFGFLRTKDHNLLENTYTYEESSDIERMLKRRMKNIIILMVAFLIVGITIIKIVASFYSNQ